MKRLSLGAGAVTLLAALVPVQATAHSAHQNLPDRIDLPDSWQPEGITTDGRSLYVGSLANGAIWRANPRTGDGEVLARGATGRVAVGVDYDRRRDLLWVAGGPTGEIRAHDADTGKLKAKYMVPAPAAPATGRFLNDLVVTERGVYVTDSMNQELAVIPFRKGHHHGDSHMLPPRSAVKLLPLTGDVKFVAGEFNLNGIVRFEGKLLSIQSNTGQLFRINARTGDTDEVDVRGGSLVNGDGLERDGDLLYVVRNQNNRIAVVELDDDADDGRVVGTLRDKDLDVPATVALVRHSLYAANARFGVEITPDTPYWVTRLDEFDD
jgi:sugar lactone lactonase YvrE